MTKPNLIEEATAIVGATNLANGCGVDRRALKFWREKGELPKTEWTGETEYSRVFEGLTEGKVTRHSILFNQTHQLTEGIVYKLPLELLRADPDQPRRQFGSEDLQELADSLAVDGQETPITFRLAGVDEGGLLILIHGERRWRASQIANMDTIDGVLDAREDVTPGERVFRQIADNTGKPLSPWDWSCTIAYLHDEAGLADQAVSDELTKRGLKGFSRPVVSNYRRLQKLPTAAQEMIEAGWLTPAHGKYLLAIKDSKTQSGVIACLVKSKNNGADAPTVDGMNLMVVTFCSENYRNMESHDHNLGGWPCVDPETDCKGCAKRIDIAKFRFCKDGDCFKAKHEEGKRAQEKEREKQREAEEKEEREFDALLEKVEADPTFEVEDPDLQEALEDAKKTRDARKQLDERHRLQKEYEAKIKDAIKTGDISVAITVLIVEMFDEIPFSDLLARVKADQETMLREAAIEISDAYYLDQKEVGIALEIDPPEGLEDA